MKTVTVLNSSTNKVTDTATVFKFCLWNDGVPQDVTGKKVTATIANASGYLFDEPIKVNGQHIDLDFSSKLLKELTPDVYSFEFNVTNPDGNVEIYPTEGTLQFTITENLRGTQGNLVPQVTFDAVLQSVDEKVAEYTSTIVKGDKGDPGKDGIVPDFGKTDDLLPKNSATVVGKLNNELTDRGLNVKWFGAIGDGIADDTQAFKSALAQALDTLNGTVFVPSGKFKITESLDIPDRINLVGSGTSASIFMPTGVPYLFSTKAYSSIQNIRVNTQNNGRDLNVVELAGKTSTTSTTFRHITIMNGQDGFITNGFYIAPEGKSASSLAMVYPNTFEDIYMLALSNGIVIENKAFAFVNSNLFSNIVIRDYRESAIHIFASSSDAQGVASNEFSHIDIEGRSPLSPANQTPFVMTTGVHNNFKDVVVWNDNHATVPAMTIKLDRYQKNSFSLRDNRFSGKVEGTINISQDLAKINDLQGIEINDWVNKHLNGGISILKGRMQDANINQLPADLISSEVKNATLGFPRLMNVVPKTLLNGGFGVDDVSPFVKISDSLQIPLNGSTKKYVQSSTGFSVVFDYELSVTDEAKTSITPNVAYYSLETKEAKPFVTKQVDGAVIGVNQFRSSVYLTPNKNDDLTGYDDYVLSLAMSGTDTIKVRHVYLVGGIYSPNMPIIESGQLVAFKALVDHTAAINSFDDLGLLSLSSQNFETALLTETDIANDKKIITYPALIM